MPVNLDPGDRKLLLIAGTVLLLLIAVTVALSPNQDEGEGQGVPTTYSTASGGAQAAYTLLRDLGYDSERWEKSPTELPSDARGTILVIANPASIFAGRFNLPEKDEREALLNFARAGGWIIYAGDFPFLFVGDGQIAPTLETHLTPTARSFAALTPSPLTRDATKISMLADNQWSFWKGPQVPLYGNPGEVVAVTWKVGEGRIVWWASATPITNSGITREGNLPFFLDCIQAARPGTPPSETTVLWDEYFHGYRGSLWGYFRETPVPWALYQLVFVAIFLLLAFSRRSGPLYMPVTPSRLSPLEFVDTLGDLYRRGQAGPSAVRVAYQRFRTLLLRRLALAPSVSNAELEAAVRERLGWKQPGFLDTLQRADRATRQGDLHSGDALKIVQALEHYEVLFGLKPRPDKS